MQRDEIIMSLSGITHPETGDSIVTSGMVGAVEVADDRCLVRITPQRRRDPFINSVKRQIIGTLQERFDGLKVEVEVGEPAPAPEIKEHDGTSAIRKTVAIASGKGGVGKSTVTANLAVVLNKMGYRVGILDADIYGPSIPKLFGIEGYQPASDYRDGLDYIVPAVVDGIKIISIGFFINPDDALLWRGPMAVSALKQLINQTLWEELDFLLIDMPPGTGDIHLSVVQEQRVDGAVIVSTPQQVALADVTRGIKMFGVKGIDVPVLGIIENMAWFTPAELPENRYYLFGRGGARALASREGVPFLGEIPIIQSIMEQSDSGRPASADNTQIGEYYKAAAEKIVENLSKSC